MESSFPWTIRVAGRRLLFGSALAGATLALNWEVIQAFWLSSPIAGFDGTSHAVVGEYYSEHIYPATWGWMPMWFAGMPFPQFYPPLFYFCVAIFHHLLPLSYPVVLKSVLTGLLVLLPILSAWVVRMFTRTPYAALTTGAMTVFFLSYEGPGSGFGISVDATLRNGLFTHLLGYICLLMWLYFFLKARQSPRARGLSMLFLLFTLLSNAHIVPVAAIVFLVTATHDVVTRWGLGESRGWARWILGYATLGLLPLAGAGFWYIPLAAYYDYLTTMALPSMELASTMRIAAAPLGLTLAALAVAAMRRQREVQILALVCLVVVMLSIVDSDTVLRSLPLQPFRFFAAFLFLSSLPAGYVLANLVNMLDVRGVRVLAWGILMLPFMWTLHGANARRLDGFGFIQDTGGAVPTYALHRIPKSVGLTTVEVHVPNGQPSHFILNAFLAREGFETTYSVFRESAISSVFMTPLRNSLSAQREAWGVDTFLAYDPQFLEQDLDTDLDRAQFMGVDRFWVVSDEMKQVMNGTSRLRTRGVYGTWELHEFVEPVIRAQVLDYEPAVFFGPVSFKKRRTSDYDFVRLQEEIFFRGEFDVLLARAEDPRLDVSPDLDRFQVAVVADYRYSDLDQAFYRLMRFSEQGLLICIEADDPLYRRLATLNGPGRPVLVTRLQGVEHSLQPLRDQLQRLLQLMRDKRISVAEGTTFQVSDVEFGAQTIHVSLAGNPSRKLPVLVKASYFPTWRRMDANEPIYMATPTYMLTFADGDVHLTFEQGTAVRWGVAVSLLAMILVGLFSVGAVASRRRGHSGPASHKIRQPDLTENNLILSQILLLLM